jgi:hypothetical protein
MTRREIDESIGKLTRELGDARRKHEAAKGELRRKGNALILIGQALVSDPDSIPFPATGYPEQSELQDAMSEMIHVVEFAQLEQLVRKESVARRVVEELEISAKRAGIE